MSRAWIQAIMRAMQGMKEQATKCDLSFNNKSLIEASSSAKGVRRISGGVLKSGKSGGGDEKLKEAEESLRTVMYLSCWGPN